jgi:hypothetical protein
LSTRIIASPYTFAVSVSLGLDGGEQRPPRVLGRHFADRKGPGQPEPRVVVHQAAFDAGRVELAHLVARLGVVLEHLVAVRKPLRNVERPVVVGRKLDRDVLEIGGALGTQVDDDVEDRAARRPHQLGLGSGRILEVHAAQRAPVFVERDVGLRDQRFQPVVGELPLAERAGEEAAVVLATLDVDDEGALELGFGEDHWVVAVCWIWSKGLRRSFLP